MLDGRGVGARPAAHFDSPAGVAFPPRLSRSYHAPCPAPAPLRPVATDEASVLMERHTARPSDLTGVRGDANMCVFFFLKSNHLTGGSGDKKLVIREKKPGVVKTRSTFLFRYIFYLHSLFEMVGFYLYAIMCLAILSATRQLKSGELNPAEGNKTENYLLIFTIKYHPLSSRRNIISAME